MIFQFDINVLQVFSEALPSSVWDWLVRILPVPAEAVVVNPPIPVRGRLTAPERRSNRASSRHLPIPAAPHAFRLFLIRDWGDAHQSRLRGDHANPAQRAAQRKMAERMGFEPMIRL